MYPRREADGFVKESKLKLDVLTVEEHGNLPDKARSTEALLDRLSTTLTWHLLTGGYVSLIMESNAAMLLN
jgi:hypothetical protein